RQLLEMELERARQKPRDRRLAGAGRAPEDDRMRPVRGDHPPDRTIRPDQVILAHALAQILRPQPVGQRARRILGETAGFEEIAHDANIAKLRAVFTFYVTPIKYRIDLKLTEGDSSRPLRATALAAMLLAT